MLLTFLTTTASFLTVVTLTPVPDLLTQFFWGAIAGVVTLAASIPAALSFLAKRFVQYRWIAAIIVYIGVCAVTLLIEHLLG